MVTGARVLELGCGAGGNLLPMAATLPGGQFVGIDLSERQVYMAQTAAQAANLGNVEFLAGDALSLAPTLAGPMVQRRIAPDWLRDLYLASPVRPLGQDPNGARGEAFFATPDGGRISMTVPGAIAALNHLALT